ncbi:hypothetical protein E2C01_033667 [Portunus trituberculatus]|uniref:Uncharacterized protein n=1 Tax=Portunus trituberculatus TaxID=210409 RepID=A0A5B7F694_PORTR|nr:hypothetical protein [Portunus trituberculatus]
MLRRACCAVSWSTHRVGVCMCVYGCVLASTTNPPVAPKQNTLDDLDDISDGFSRLALRRGNPPQPLTGMSHLGLADLGLAAFTGHQAASPTENGFWPSTSPSQAASPLATSPPDPWGGLGQSPPEAWEMFSRSPNTAFLHSCQSPPSSSMFPTTLFSPPHPIQSPSPIQSPPPPVHSAPQVVQSDLKSHPPTVQSPSDTNPFPFPTFSTTGEPNDPFSIKLPQQKCHNNEQLPSLPVSPVSPVSPNGNENPFLSTTNPFIAPPTPLKEMANSSPQPPVECPRVLVASGSSGCSPGRPVWTADLFSGSKNKDVICS